MAQKASIITRQIIDGIRLAYTKKITPATSDYIVNMTCSISNQTLSCNIKGNPTAPDALNYLNSVATNHATSLNKVSCFNQYTKQSTEIVTTTAQATSSATVKHVLDHYQSYLVQSGNSGNVKNFTKVTDLKPKT